MDDISASDSSDTTPVRVSPKDPNQLFSVVYRPRQGRRRRISRYLTLTPPDQACSARYDREVDEARPSNQDAASGEEAVGDTVATVDTTTAAQEENDLVSHPDLLAPYFPDSRNDTLKASLSRALSAAIEGRKHDTTANSQGKHATLAERIKTSRVVQCSLGEIDNPSWRCGNKDMFMCRRRNCERATNGVYYLLYSCPVFPRLSKLTSNHIATKLTFLCSLSNMSPQTAIVMRAQIQQITNGRSTSTTSTLKPR